MRMTRARTEEAEERGRAVALTRRLVLESDGFSTVLLGAGNCARARARQVPERRRGRRRVAQRGGAAARGGRGEPEQRERAYSSVVTSILPPPTSVDGSRSPPAAPAGVGT